MDLQNTFYTLGIGFMALYTLLIIALVVGVFLIKAKISQIQRQVEGKLADVKEVIDNPDQAAAGVGAALANVAYHKFENFSSRRKKGRKKRH